ncbi:MAG TPA: ABC transporter permease [Herpetosiphonaceae bacterium]
MSNDSLAAPPYPPPRRTLAISLWRYLILTRVLLTEYRTTWFYHSFFGTVMPLGLIFFFKTMNGAMSVQQAVFLLGGNMALSIAYGPTQMMIVKIGWARETREFDYWAMLPIPKLALILAMVSVYLLFAVPGIVSSYVFGIWMFGLRPEGSLILIPLVPLSALSLTGFGALLGMYARTGQTAMAYAQALIGFVTFLSPMLMPLEAMPRLLQMIAIFVPTTYVADAFRMVLSGNWGARLMYDILILTALVGLFLLVSHRRLDWRTS